jgi:hypothetical protein
MKFKSLLIFSGLMLFLSGSVLAQGKSQDKATKKDTTEVRKSADNAKSKQDQDKGKKKDKADAAKSENNGNAYGKNKGDMTGREFGRMRSEQARAKVKESVDELDAEILESEMKVSKRKEALAEARVRLESIKQNSKISAEEVSKKESILSQVVIRLAELEAEIAAKKAKALQIKNTALDKADEKEDEPDEDQTS